VVLNYQRRDGSQKHRSPLRAWLARHWIVFLSAAVIASIWPLSHQWQASIRYGTRSFGVRNGVLLALSDCEPSEFTGGCWRLDSTDRGVFRSGTVTSSKSALGIRWGTMDDWYSRRRPHRALGMFTHGFLIVPLPYMCIALISVLLLVQTAFKRLARRWSRASNK
jgi:hypothetical protein